MLQCDCAIFTISVSGYNVFSHLLFWIVLITETLILKTLVNVLIEFPSYLNLRYKDFFLPINAGNSALGHKKQDKNKTSGCLESH